MIIGGALTPVSAYGGTQAEVTLMFYWDQGGAHNWWFKYGNKWIGYYPNNWFDTDGLADRSEGIEFGGEIVNYNTDGNHTTTDMGSGHFPSEGLQHSAYIKRIKYMDMNNLSQDADALITGVTDASYYDIALYSSGDTNWLNYFFFGGPGRIAIAHDHCTDPITLTDNVEYAQSTVGATDDVLYYSGVISKGIWFTYTPPQTGIVVVETCLSDFDTVFEVFNGPCGALVSVAFNDNNGPVCAGSQQASASFNGTAGTTYYICAGAYGGLSGNLHIRAGLHRPVLAANLAGAATGNVQIAWSSLSGVNYQVQFKTNLNDSSWSILTNLQADSSSTAVRDPTTPLPTRRFYRVQVQ